MNRSEHMAWCKQRAIEYCDMGDAENAFASFMSDIGKHPETKMLGVFAMSVGMLHVGDVERMRTFIEGFAE